MVKLYALSTCPWCKKTKKLLEENNIVYECIDVDLMSGIEQEHAMELVERLAGGRSFPVTVVGTKVIAGFEPQKILEAVENEG